MLVNHQIRAYSPPLFTPYDYYNVHAMSIGLQVGDGLLAERQLFNGHGGGLLKKFQLPGLVHSIAWSVLDLIKNDHTLYRPWSLAPGEFILVTTKQELVLPYSMHGLVVPAEESRLNGYGISNQAVPYGHQGPITLAVVNMTKKTQLPVFPGLLLAELHLYLLDSTPEADIAALEAGTPEPGLRALPQAAEEAEFHVIS